jgi:hypothetical protein
VLLAKHNGVSVGIEWKETKPFHVCPYKNIVVHEIIPVDYENRVRLCNWFFSDVHDGLIDPKLIFFTDEANFYLSGYVTS